MEAVRLDKKNPPAYQEANEVPSSLLLSARPVAPDRELFRVSDHLASHDLMAVGSSSLAVRFSHSACKAPVADPTVPKNQTARPPEEFSPPVALDSEIYSGLAAPVASKFSHSDFLNSARLPAVFAANSSSRAERAMATRRLAEAKLELFTASQWKGNPIFEVVTQELTKLNAREKQAFKKKVILLTLNIGISSDGFIFLGDRIDYPHPDWSKARVFFRPSEIAFKDSIYSKRDNLLAVARSDQFSFPTCSKADIETLLEKIDVHSTPEWLYSRDSRLRFEIADLWMGISFFTFGLALPYTLFKLHRSKSHPEKLKAYLPTDASITGWTKLAPAFEAAAAAQKNPNDSL